MNIQSITKMFFLSAVLGACTPVSESASETSQSDWNLSSSIDPMNDDEIVAATRTFDLDGIVIHAEVKCVSGNMLSYQFNAYDEDNNGLSYKAYPTNSGEMAVPYEIRVDDQEGRDLQTVGIDYSNQLTISAEVNEVIPIPVFRSLIENFGLPIKEMQKAKSVLLKLYFLNGERLLSIDQTDENIKKVMEFCQPYTQDNSEDTEIDRDYSQSNKQVDTFSEKQPEERMPEQQVIDNPNSTATSPRPVGQPALWVTLSDYPPKALREGRSGSVGFRLKIDENGDVKSCEVTESSGFDDLDGTTCALLSRRAQFRPSVDEDGRPLEAIYASRVVWSIPVEASHDEQGD